MRCGWYTQACQSPPHTKDIQPLLLGPSSRPDSGYIRRHLGASQVYPSTSHLPLGVRVPGPAIYCPQHAPGSIYAAWPPRVTPPASGPCLPTPDPNFRPLAGGLCDLVIWCPGCLGEYFFSLGAISDDAQGSLWWCLGWTKGCWGWNLGQPRIRPEFSPL